MNSIRKSIATALMIALCVVLPMAFHAIPNGGTLFSPMHLPVLIAGIIAGPLYGLFCGIAGPVLSFLITGMPGAAYLPVMMIELGIYGLVTGLMMHFVKTGKTIADLYISLVAAMLSGRVITGICRALIFAKGKYSVAAWAAGYFVSCWPAIVIQLILIPMLYLALEKAGLTERRYNN